MDAKGAKKFFYYGTGLSFEVPVLDEKGNPTFKTDKNGNNKLPVVKRYAFKIVKNKGDDKLAVFIYDPETMPANVLEALLDLKKDPLYARLIVTEEEYERNKNPKAYEEKAAREKAEKRALDVESENKRLREEIDKLKQRRT